MVVMADTVTIGSWNEEEGMYTDLQQIPVVAHEGDKLPPVGSLVYVTSDYEIEPNTYIEAGVYEVYEVGQLVQTTNKHSINQEDTTMSDNDSISRAGLLSILSSREMTQQEMIELVRGAAPLEVDSVHNPYVTFPSTYIEGCRGGYGYGYVPDHMG